MDSWLSHPLPAGRHPWALTQTRGWSKKLAVREAREKRGERERKYSGRDFSLRREPRQSPFESLPTMFAFYLSPSCVPLFRLLLRASTNPGNPTFNRLFAFLCFNATSASISYSATPPPLTFSLFCTFWAFPLTLMLAAKTVQRFTGEALARPPMVETS